MMWLHRLAVLVASPHNFFASGMQGPYNGACTKLLVNVFLQDCSHKHQLVHCDICELPSNLEEMQ